MERTEPKTKLATISVSRERYADCSNEVAREFNRQCFIVQESPNVAWERREDFMRNSTVFTVEGPHELVEPWIHATMAFARPR